MVMFIYFYIGNIGVIVEDEEFDKIQVVGLIICDLFLIVSSWCKEKDLDEYLCDNNIQGIVEIDICKLI